MASLYWVGGASTWNNTAGTKWATSSGGAGGAAVPTAADDVFFDAASGAVSVALSANSVARSINCTGFTGTITHPSSTDVNLGDATAGASNIALKLVAGMAYTKSAGTSRFVFVSTSATQQTIDTAGKTMGSITINGAGSSYILASSYTAAQDSNHQIIITAGTFDTGNFAIIAGQMASSNTNVRTVTLGSSSINLQCNAGGVGVWGFQTTTNLTFNRGTSSIVTNVDNQTVQGGGLTYYDFEFQNRQTLNGANTFNTLKIASVGNNQVLTLAANQTCAVFSVTGTLPKKGRVISNQWGVQRTITATTVTISGSGCDFQDIVGAGAGTWDSASQMGDMGGNSGITFDTPRTLYWVGNGGNWHDTARWSLSSGGASGELPPTPQDNANIDANSISSAAQTITSTMTRLGKNINFTGVLNTPAFSAGIANEDTKIFGNLTVISAMTVSGTTSRFSFEGRGTHAVTCNGRSMSNSWAFRNFGGTYTLQDAVSLTGTNQFAVEAGTFNQNGQAITCDNFQFENSTFAKTLNLDSTITLNRTSADNIVRGTDSNTTINATNATWIVANASANTRTFFLNSFPAGNMGTIQYTVPNSSGALNVFGSNNWKTWNIADGVVARSILPESSRTQTFSQAPSIEGVSGALITLDTIGGAGQFTFSLASGVVNCNYLSVKNSAATGGATWYAGPNSTNVSNNTGWIFTAAIFATTKSMRYAIRRTNSATKPMRYAIRKANAPTKPMQYCIKRTLSTTKPMRYAVRITHGTRPNTPELIQSTSATVSAQTALQATLNGVQVGNTILVVSIQSHLVSTPTMSDNRGNTYSRNYQIGNGTSHTISVFSSKITTGGSVTVTLDGNGQPSDRVIFVREYKNLIQGAGGVLDGTVLRDTGHGSGSGTGVAINSDNVSSEQQDLALFVAANASSRTYLQGPGYVNFAQASIGTWGVAIQDRVAPAAGLDTGDFTQSGAGAWFEVGIAYKPTANNDYPPETKSMRYAIRRALSATKPLRYAIRDEVVVTKQMRYAIEVQGAVTKLMKYMIRDTATPLSLSSRYAIRTSPKLMKSLGYRVSRRRSQESTPVESAIGSEHEPL